MFCKQCGAENKEGSNFCKKCGTPISSPAETATPETFSQNNIMTAGNVGQSYCGSCGKTSDSAFAFCPHCGAGKGVAAANLYSNRMLGAGKKNPTKIIVAVAAVVVVALVICIIAIVANSCSPESDGESLESQLVGSWSNNKGLDSTVYSFKKSGAIAVSSFNFDYTGTYSVKGKTLCIERDDHSYEYEYSTLAKEDDSDGWYWYIDSDTLYLNGELYFKKN